MTNDQKYNLISRNLEEVLTEEELKALIESGTPLKHYIGFEISGKVHLGTGLASMLVIKDLQDAGVETNILLADWHTWLNKKLDGTLETARRMAREYFEEALKAAALCVGADPEKINFILGSELYEQKGSEYWSTVIKVSKATTISRMLRSTTIMGRKESEIKDSAMLIYPAMQSADIFQIGVNLAHAGSDQRNVHVVARNTAGELGFKKPVALHHHLLLGLVKPIQPLENFEEHKTHEYSQQSLDAAIELRKLNSSNPTVQLSTEDLERNEHLNDMIKMTLKMSKSKPDSAVFIHDSPDEIKRKVKAAFSPPGFSEFNPILDWIQNLVFAMDKEFVISTKFDGQLTFSNYDYLKDAYVEGKIHPEDLKNSLAEWLIKKLAPARKYFEDSKRKAALEEIEQLTSR